MLKLVHRVNTIEALKKTPPQYGVEIDIRTDRDRLILNHEPFGSGNDLVEYLRAYRHAFVIFNIKEAGIEQRVIDLAQQFGVHDYFLLDVEFPYLYKASRRGIRQIAVRYSEEESIETVRRLNGRVDWVWIDVMTKLPLDQTVVGHLRGFKTCLVSPECWGRPEDITAYQQQMAELKFLPDAVMCDPEYLAAWG